MNGQDKIAIAKQNIKKEDRYDYEKGTEFKVLDIRERLILVEDWLGFQHWIQSAFLEIREE